VTRRLWTTNLGTAALPAASAPGWVCQLIHLDISDAAFVLDFVALEQPPMQDFSLPAGTPFSLLINRGEVESDKLSEAATLSQWAGGADLVTITSARSLSSSTLCLSADRCHLVLEISAG
jgi:hypothetical protein